MNLRPPGYETSRSRSSDVRLAHLSHAESPQSMLDQLRWVQNGYKNARQFWQHSARPSSPIRRTHLDRTRDLPRVKREVASADHHCALRSRIPLEPGRFEKRTPKGRLGPNGSPLTHHVSAGWVVVKFGRSHVTKMNARTDASALTPRYRRGPDRSPPRDCSAQAEVRRSHTGPGDPRHIPMRGFRSPCGELVALPQVAAKARRLRCVPRATGPRHGHAHPGGVGSPATPPPTPVETAAATSRSSGRRRA